MDTSHDSKRTVKSIDPGRFTRVSVQTRAGEIEARLSEMGKGLGGWRALEILTAGP